MMHYVTSDLHGYPLESFLNLLKQAGFSHRDELYILGDVIDRNGDGGVETLRWIMGQPNVLLLMGNHEDMLLKCSFLFEEITPKAIEAMSAEDASAYLHWLSNGALPTVKSLCALHKEEPDMFEDLLDTLADLPLYDILKVKGKTYILTHAGLGHFSPDKELDEYEKEDLIWHRPTLAEQYFPNATVVFGHTPTQYLDENNAGRMIRTDTWLCVDTGAAGGGSPMLLRLEDEKEFYAK